MKATGWTHLLTKRGDETITKKHRLLLVFSHYYCYPLPTSQNPKKNQEKNNNITKHNKHDNKKTTSEAMRHDDVKGEIHLVPGDVGPPLESLQGMDMLYSPGLQGIPLEKVVLVSFWLVVCFWVGFRWLFLVGWFGWWVCLKLLYLIKKVSGALVIDQRK